MKTSARQTLRNYGSLLAGIFLVLSAMPAWAGDKVPALTGPAAPRGDAAVIRPQQAEPLTCNLWNQPRSGVNTTPYANQQFEETQAGFDIFLADDFMSFRPWLIDTIFVPGELWNGAMGLAEANTLHFEIYHDRGGRPDGDPWGNGNPPVWSLAVPPTDSRVTIETTELDPVLGIYESNVTLALDPPVRLNSGVYWLVFYPQLDWLPPFYHQYGRFAADTANRSPAKVENPGQAPEWEDLDYFLPQNWENASSYLPGFTQHDLAFCLQGKESFYWPMFVPATTGNKQQ
ncbi:MAG: hypothetical protein RBR09_03485 [Desulfobulbaceae bacterium]|nr:hypothetical protein [Desulfobulbaceae bacterium]MDY0350294.1 hypothetical protein [Desulfobulbaceae bacterium]